MPRTSRCSEMSRRPRSMLRRARRRSCPRSSGSLTTPMSWLTHISTHSCSSTSQHLWPGLSNRLSQSSLSSPSSHPRLQNSCPVLKTSTSQTAANLPLSERRQWALKTSLKWWFKQRSLPSFPTTRELLSRWHQSLLRQSSKPNRRSINRLSHSQRHLRKLHCR